MTLSASNLTREEVMFADLMDRFVKVDAERLRFAGIAWECQRLLRLLEINDEILSLRRDVLIRDIDNAHD